MSRESIQCLICGKHYKALGSHINRIHNLNETSYKQQFGIPYTVGLLSAPTARRFGEECTKTIPSEQRIIYLASARASLKQKVESGDCKWRLPVSSV